MSERPRGASIQPVTATSGDQFVREVQQLSEDLRMEIETRRFFMRRDSKQAWLMQMDNKGKVVCYCRQSIVSKPENKAVWKKMADLDCDGNLRIRGTLTQSVAFDRSENL